jgi:hypothetical protein
MTLRKTQDVVWPDHDVRRGRHANQEGNRLVVPRPTRKAQPAPLHTGDARADDRPRRDARSRARPMGADDRRRLVNSRVPIGRRTTHAPMTRKDNGPSASGSPTSYRRTVAALWIGREIVPSATYTINMRPRCSLRRQPAASRAMHQTFAGTPGGGRPARVAPSGTLVPTRP